MSRVKRGVTTHARHRKIIKMAKGFRNRSNNCYRSALPSVEKALQYAYRDRRVKKRTFRALWIQRINAGARQCGMRYSTFMDGLKKANIGLDRKVLADLAVHEFATFEKLVTDAKAALA